MSEPDDAQADQAAARAADLAAQLTRDIDVVVRREQAESLIKSHVLGAAALALVPVAVLDIAALVASQVALARSLARCYDVPFHELRAKSLILSLLAGSAPTLSVLALSSGAKLMPGIGTLAGSGSIGVAGAATTHALGRVLVHHFEHGGTLLTLDLSRLRKRFRRELRRGWRVAAAAERSAQKDASAAGVGTPR